MKCLVIDDEPAAIQVLESYLKRVPTLQHEASFVDPVAALHYVQNHDIDLLFLDLNMPHLNGIHFLELLNGKAKVILTTAYAEFALEGYKYDVIDYLCKPIDFKEFLRAIQKVEDRIKAGPKKEVLSLQDFILVKSDHKGKYVRIALSEIIFVEAYRNYVTIFLRGDRKVLTLLSMKELVEKLPSQHFVRVHKTYLVGLEYLNMIDGGEVILHHTVVRVPIGITFRETFFEKLEERFMQP
jgi:two-component system LytT family response regulator